MPDNQTRDEWLELPAVAQNPGALGTGLYLQHWDDPVRGETPNIPYEPFVAQAYSSNYDAFVWVPHAVAAYQQLTSQATCAALRCAGKCPPGCICDRTRGRCK
jgi:hypothetical protein